jgi:translation initiation factor 2B subunit (eIF-2B alpha/beta/delta family)
MKKQVIISMALIFMVSLSCRDSEKAKEEQEMELTIKKIDSLEREIEAINQRIDIISTEAEQAVEEIN